MKIYTVPLGNLQTNCYVVATEQGNAVLIDPGAQAEKLMEELEALGLTPVQILLTHAHFDHIGAVKALQQAYPALRLALGAEDLDMFSDPDLNLSSRFAHVEDFAELRYDALLQDGDTVAVDELVFTAITTPGHTKGSLCYLLGDVIFSGDTLFRREVGRCDLYGGSFETIKESLRKLYALPNGDYTVYPGHGEPTTIAEEKSENPYVRG